MIALVRHCRLIVVILSLLGAALAGSGGIPSAHAITCSGPVGSEAPTPDCSGNPPTPNPNIKLSPTSLPAAYSGVHYSQTITASGGTGPYKFYEYKSTPPAGLTLSQSGVLSGTLTVAPGSYTFTIEAVDATNTYNTQSYTLTVNSCPAITVATTDSNPPNPSATVGASYSQGFSASGSSGYTWSASGLPSGLSIDATTGAISGSPTAAGTFNVTVTATDLSGCTGQTAYSLTVSASPTFVLVRDMSAQRHGVLVTVHWRLASQASILGFELFAGRHQLTRHLIHVHAAAMYRTTVRDGWHAPLTLRVILSIGQTVNLPVGTA